MHRQLTNHNKSSYERQNPLMPGIAEKPDLINTIAGKVWTEAEISSSLGSTNLVFRINPQGSCLGKEKS
jgi:hypothetical protein